MDITKQDDNDTDPEIADADSADPGKSTMSPNIQDDDLYNPQELLHLHQAPRDKTKRTTMVLLAKKWRHANIVITGTSLRNLRHLAGAIASPLLKCQNSTINILRKSDFEPALVLPCPRLPETRMFLSSRPVEITTFLNTKRLLLRYRNSS